MTVYDHWSQVPRTQSEWPWKFFRPFEIACRGTGKLEVVNGLLDRLDVLRSRCGFPLNLSSVFRTPYFNAKCGGSPRSMHLFGLAADISIINQDRNLIHRLAKEEGFTGFGFYRTFLHIDLGRPRTWGAKW